MSTQPTPHTLEFSAALDDLRAALPKHSIPSLSEVLPNRQADFAFEYTEPFGLTLVDVFGRDAPEADRLAARHWLELLKDALQPLKITHLYAILLAGSSKSGDLPARTASIAGLLFGGEFASLPNGLWRTVGRIRYRIETGAETVENLNLAGHTAALPRLEGTTLDRTAAAVIGKHLTEAGQYWGRFAIEVTPWILASGLMELVVEATVPERDFTGFVAVPIRGNA